MADHVDYAADYLRGAVTYGKGVYENLQSPEFPWEGMAISMFESLAARGFVMNRIDFVNL